MNALVWFKKDLRNRDHAPLERALEWTRNQRQGHSLSTQNESKVYACFLIEPEWLNATEFDPCHLKFALECLRDLEVKLWTEQKIQLFILKASALDGLERMIKTLKIGAVFSHEETGMHWTFERDRSVKRLLRASQVDWFEYPQFGVVRGLKNRDRWERERNRILIRPIIKNSAVHLDSSAITTLNLNGESEGLKLKSEVSAYPEVPTLSELGVGPSQKLRAQKGGRDEAISWLNSFFETRGEFFRGSISSPLSAVEHCSRLSPYLTWGCLSLTELSARLDFEKRKRAAQGASGSRWMKSLSAFESRLFWHCHFIQKLESQPELEFQNANRAFDGLRERDFNEEYFQAWCEGRTGFPMIDAAMRSLHKAGWINFRMRAMLVSFASYQLWLDWRRTGLFLAKQFVDFEPGIHWSQMQMQSGVTGINMIRIYSPEKQAQDQDPKGEFIGEHCPELLPLAGPDRGAPWNVPPGLLMMSGVVIGRDYPAPIVDPVESYRRAKDRIFTMMKRSDVRKEATEVMQRHGSRSTRRFGSRSRPRTKSV